MSAYEIDEYAREHRWLMCAAQVGIPCPRVLATGWLDESQYLIQTFISGVNGGESSLDPLLLWRELGRLARLIHSIPVEDADAKWRKYLGRVMAGMTDHDVKIALGVYRASQQDEIRRVFQKLGGVAFRYGLNHCDLHPKNTLVDGNGKVFLLDWGSASRDVNLVPHGELASLLWYHGPEDEEFRAFVDGYGLSPSALSSVLPEVKALDMLLSLGFSEPPRSDFGHELLARARRLIAQDLPSLVEWASR
jgi:tRNA A-37 threonylcarbamoyl transferase component Bud32